MHLSLSLLLLLVAGACCATAAPSRKLSSLSSSDASNAIQEAAASFARSLDAGSASDSLAAAAASLMERAKDKPSSISIAPAGAYGNIEVSATASDDVKTDYVKVAMQIQYRSYADGWDYSSKRVYPALAVQPLAARLGSSASGSRPVNTLSAVSSTAVNKDKLRSSIREIGDEITQWVTSQADKHAVKFDELLSAIADQDKEQGVQAAQAESVPVAEPAAEPVSAEAPAVVYAPEHDKPSSNSSASKAPDAPHPPKGKGYVGAPSAEELRKLLASLEDRVASASSRVAKYLDSHSSSEPSPTVRSRRSDGIRINTIYDYGCGSSALGTYNPSSCDYSRPVIIGYEAAESVSFEVAVADASRLVLECLEEGATSIDSMLHVASPAAILAAEQRAIAKATKEAMQKARTAADAIAASSDEEHDSKTRTPAALTVQSLSCSSYNSASSWSFYSAAPMKAGGAMDSVASSYPMMETQMVGSSVAVSVTCALKVSTGGAKRIDIFSS